MPEEKVPSKDRIVASFKQLTTVSADLNDTVRELGDSIAVLESALQYLNLGVPAWHEIAGHEGRSGSYWSRDLGYTKIGHDWRIALRTTSGHEQVDDSHSEQIWAFKDAPRWMCAEAAGKLPELFDTLIKRAVETNEKIKARIPEIEDLANEVDAIKTRIASESAAKKGKR